MTNVKLLVFVLASIFCSVGHTQIKDLLNKAKSELLGESDSGDIGLGLKEALEFGVQEAVDKLSAQNGYLESPYKILIPEEAQSVITKVKMVPGFQDVESKLISKMNEAAELAAKEATPIFVGAIKELTFTDAMDILKGQDDAATTYLEDKTRIKLYDAFMPEIQKALDAVNARSYWTTVVDAYNKIPLVRKVNPELDDHVNQKALDGLFALVEVKEKDIRTNVDARKTELLQKVFAQQDKN